MGDFDDILKKKLNQLGVARQVEAVGVVEKATAEIAKIIPREDFEVISFNRGILKVRVANSAVSSEVDSCRDQLKYIIGTERIIFLVGGRFST